MKIFIADIANTNWDDEIFFSKKEKERLDNITSTKARLRFLAGRVLIKKTLAQHLKCKPQDIVIKIEKSGKPKLAFPKVDCDFNLSHSHNLLALVISKHEVGIDIEFMKKRNFLAIAKEFFSKNEFLALEKAKGELRKKLFYKFWTAKEAKIKCCSESIFQSKKVDVCKIVSYEINKDYIMSIASMNQAGKRRKQIRKQNSK